MKILCSYSGITFNCDHVPGFLSSREVSHPVFHLPQKKLISYLGKWGRNELTSIDSYLLFLSILNSSSLVEFRVPAAVTEETDSIISLHMEALAKTVLRLNTVTDPETVFPRFVITPETKFLKNIPHWIHNWNASYNDHLSGASAKLDDRELVKKEIALERLIRNPHNPIASYASKIAEWAVTAGAFPEWLTYSPFSPGIKLSCKDYWKTLIIKCASNDTLYQVPKIDLEDLLEHCELNIPIGSIFAGALFKVLRAAMEKQKNFLGLGDGDIIKTSFQIMNSTDSIEDANVRAMIQSAPEHEPTQNEYPTKFAFMKAKMRWDLSQKYGSGGSITERR